MLSRCQILHLCRKLMHQFFATLFSLFVALSHHTSLSARPVEAAELRIMSGTSAFAGSAMILPSRYQLARASSSGASYAESVCVSCRRMDSFSSDR